MCPGIEISLRRNNNWLKDNGYTMEEEAVIYDLLLQDVIDNTRWYLDNLETIPTFRVSWYTYEKMSKRPKQLGCPSPYRFVNTSKTKRNHKEMV